MALADIYQGLGKQVFEELVGTISMGSLKTYQAFESFKIRTRLPKLNRARLQRSARKLWERIREGDDELGKEIAQGVLLSHLSFVVEVLDFLEIPHDGNGFFDKQADIKSLLPEDWQKKVADHFRDRYPEALVLLYVNHLAWELDIEQPVFLG